MEDLERSLSVKFFSSYVSVITNKLLLENKKLVDFFIELNKQDLLIKDVVELPLWTISGGEVINLYSSKNSITPTKDLDTKMIIPGRYSLPLYFIDNSITFRKIQPDDGRDVSFYILVKELNMDEYFRNKNICDKSAWLDYFNNKKNFFIDFQFDQIKDYLNDQKKDYYYPIYKTILESKYRIVYDILKSFKNLYKDKNYFQTYKDNKFSFNIFNELKNLLIQYKNIKPFVEYMKQIDNENVIQNEGFLTIPINLMIPRLHKTYHKYLNYPYNVKFDKIDNNDGTFQYVDSFLNNDVIKGIDFIENINNQLLDWYNLSDDDESIIFNNYFKMHEIMRHSIPLMSLVNLKIFVNISNDYNTIELSIKQEGFFDMWTDYSAQYNEVKKAKSIYEGIQKNGDIPCIVELFKIEDNISLLKIPTISWILRDQTQMLILGLRKQKVFIENWTDQDAVFTDYQHNPLKYSNKILSILDGFDELIDDINKSIKEDNLKKYSGFFEEDKCKKYFDFIACGPDAYISYLFKEKNDYWKRIGYNKNINEIIDDVEMQDIEKEPIINVFNDDDLNSLNTYYKEPNMNIQEIINPDDTPLGRIYVECDNRENIYNNNIPEIIENIPPLRFVSPKSRVFNFMNNKKLTTECQFKKPSIESKQSIIEEQNEPEIKPYINYRKLFESVKRQESKIKNK
jgi:hypothetical protein